MKPGRRGFLHSLFAAPFLAKAAAQIEPKMEPEPLPVQKFPAVPADHLTCSMSAIPNASICFVFKSEFDPAAFEDVWPGKVIPKREGFE